mmetsp:Transcript_75948/g.210880  ORF Transcript_75948/g.210880 Transcript_75948/m.210880 type:complete len:263 (-) Transcript_75948:814-1602(-)
MLCNCTSSYMSSPGGPRISFWLDDGTNTCASGRRRPGIGECASGMTLRGSGEPSSAPTSSAKPRRSTKTRRCFTLHSWSIRVGSWRTLFTSMMRSPFHILFASCSCRMLCRATRPCSSIPSTRKDSSSIWLTSMPRVLKPGSFNTSTVTTSLSEPIGCCRAGEALGPVPTGVMNCSMRLPGGVAGSASLPSASSGSFWSKHCANSTRLQPGDGCRGVAEDGKTLARESTAGLGVKDKPGIGSSLPPQAPPPPVARGGVQKVL